MAVMPSPQKRIGIMPVKPQTPNLEKMPGIIRKPAPVGMPNLEKMPGIRAGWDTGVGNPHNIDSNNAKAARQRKMVDAIKANKGKLSNKNKANIQKAAQGRKSRKGKNWGSIGAPLSSSPKKRKLFSGSIG